MAKEKSKKKGIPRVIRDEVDIHKKTQTFFDVTVAVEPHQAKIPIPKKIRFEMNLQKGAKCTIQYNQEKRELICKF